MEKLNFSINRYFAMLPNYITDKSIIDKYTYTDFEENFLDNYEKFLKNILPPAILLKILQKITLAAFVLFFPGVRITILRR